LDPRLASKIMSPSYLDSTVSAAINAVHAKYAPHSQLWVGEAAAAWHSGQDGITNAWESSFWWADALGGLAAHNHTTYCRQTLLGGDYGLLDRLTYQPNPDFYVAQLFHQLMGNAVLSVAGAEDARGYLRIYSHCHRNGTGVVLLIINITPTTTFVLSSGGGSTRSMTPRDEYVLTGSELTARHISLNGALLTVGADGAMLPPLVPKKVPAGTGDTFSIRPQSIAFVVLPEAVASVCSSH
jgi:heparanase